MGRYPRPSLLPTWVLPTCTWAHHCHANSGTPVSRHSGVDTPYTPCVQAVELPPVCSARFLVCGCLTSTASAASTPATLHSHLSPQRYNPSNKADSWQVHTIVSGSCKIEALTWLTISYLASLVVSPSHLGSVAVRPPGQQRATAGIPGAVRNRLPQRADIKTDKVGLHRLPAI